MKWILDPSVLDEARMVNRISSDSKLAARLDMSPASISKLRLGQTTPQLGTLMKLRAMSGRSIDGMVIKVNDVTAA